MTPTPSPHPFEGLTPDRVQDALRQVGLWGDGRLQALNSFENRVYLAHLQDPLPEVGPAVVLKFYRPGRWSNEQIQEEHDFAHELAAQEVPMVAPLRLQQATLHAIDGFAFSISPYRGGRRPEFDDVEVLEWTGRLLGRLHNVGAERPFAHRPRMSLHDAAQLPLKRLPSHPQMAPEISKVWESTCQNAIDEIAKNPYWTSSNEQINIKNCRLHADCHPGNMLWTPGRGPHFVDLDDSRSGPAVQDLWMMLWGDRRQQTQQLAALLDGYEQVRPFNRQELALIEPLRTLRMIHYSDWLAQRWNDPIFPINFPWFGSRDYWQGQVDALTDQIEAMQAPTLMV